jgi:HSP20 family protein
MDLHWDPFADIANIRDRINTIFEERMRPQMRQQALDARAWAPRVDIYETDSTLVFECELPGLEREDIDIELDADRLTIKGVRMPPQDREYLRIERPAGAFHRSFAIGVPVEQAAVSAAYRDGLLTVTVPKAKEPETKRVKVTVE